MLDALDGSPMSYDLFNIYLKELLASQSSSAMVLYRPRHNEICKESRNKLWLISPA